jgi:hypothetical protein
MSNPITTEELLPLVRGIVGSIAETVIQNAALHAAVKNALSDSFGELFESHYQAALGLLREQWKPLLGTSDVDATKSLLSILEKFEGPVQ